MKILEECFVEMRTKLLNLYIHKDGYTAWGKNEYKALL